MAKPRMTPNLYAYLLEQRMRQNITTSEAVRFMREIARMRNTVLKEREKRGYNVRGETSSD